MNVWRAREAKEGKDKLEPVMPPTKSSAVQCEWGRLLKSWLLPYQVEKGRHVKCVCNIPLLREIYKGLVSADFILGTGIELNNIHRKLVLGSPWRPNVADLRSLQ